MSALPQASLTAIYPGQSPSRERLLFQFNPTSIRKSLKVNYGVTQPINGSHEIAHYRGTSSGRIPLQLFFTVLGRETPAEFPNLAVKVTDDMVVAQLEASVGGAGGFSVLGGLAQTLRNVNNPGSPGLKGVERFLEGLCYNDLDSGMHSPPFVIFEWPNVLRLIGRIEDLDIGYDQFSTEDLRGTVLVAEMMFREDSPSRINQGIVRRTGAFRADDETVRRLENRADSQTVATQTVRSRVPIGGSGAAPRGATP